jgi:hypothetical protein
LPTRVYSALGSYRGACREERYSRHQCFVIREEGKCKSVSL